MDALTRLFFTGFSLDMQSLGGKVNNVSCGGVGYSWVAPGRAT